ncbi:MAG TPA: MFS transporter, partial [Burkholderiaceae bacterium]|nr:MFS transporter [Burkholderiaceae bacterium]
MTQLGRPPCAEAQIAHGELAVDCEARQKRWVLVAAIIASSMAFIDGTVVNVALPAIQRALSANAFQAQWVVESYALFLASLLLVGGALGDRYGRRRVFAIGVALFGLASLACALSSGVQALIAARAVQGVGAALLVPGSLSMISAAFPQGERGKAIGTWSGASGVTAALGPVLGGFLVDHYSWTWAFLINLPFALVVLAIAWWRLPESRSRRASAASLDLVGAVLATVALGGIVYAFIEAPTQGWGAVPVLISLALGIVASIAFVVAEARTREPMLPLRLFRSRNFSGANLLTLWLYAALGGGLYFFPLNLIQVHGYSATAAGAAFLPFIAIMFVLSGWAGHLVDRFGARGPLVIGPLIAGVGFAMFAWPGAGGGMRDYWTTFFPAVVVLGFGMTVTVAPLTTTVMGAVDTDQAGVASGVNNAVSRAAALLAIAVFGVVSVLVFEPVLLDGLRDAGVSAQTQGYMQSQVDKLAAAAPPPGLAPDEAQHVEGALAGAAVAGFRWVMGLSALLAVLSAL